MDDSFKLIPIKELNDRYIWTREGVNVIGSLKDGKSHLSNEEISASLMINCGADFVMLDRDGKSTVTLKDVGELSGLDVSSAPKDLTGSIKYSGENTAQGKGKQS